MDRYIVYKHITPSGKVYIGITKREKARDRWKYGHGYKQNRHFYNAILKYGWKNIEHQILASNLSLEEACTLEKELISLYTKQGICYNIAEGGQNGNTMKRTEEEKQHLSEFFKEYFKMHEHPLQGKKHSEESKRRMSENRKNQWQNNYDYLYSFITKIKVGVFNIITGEYQEYLSEKEAAKDLNIKETTFRRHVDEGSVINNFIIIPLDSTTFEEALLKAYNREKLNIHCGGQEVSVVQLDLDGNYIATYPSAKQASLQTRIPASCIGKTCRKQQRQAGGYLWVFNREYLRQH